MIIKIIQITIIVILLIYLSVFIYTFVNDNNKYDSKLTKIREIAIRTGILIIWTIIWIIPSYISKYLND